MRQQQQAQRNLRNEARPAHSTELYIGDGAASLCLSVGRAPSPAAFEVVSEVETAIEVWATKIKVKGGGRGRPPHTFVRV